MIQENMERFLTTQNCQKFSTSDLKIQNKLSTEQLLARGYAIIEIPVDDGVINQKVDLVPTKLHFGVRLWFVCPRCGEKKGVLYLPPPFTEQFRCRECWNLIYPSQAFHRLKVYEMIQKHSIEQKLIEIKLANPYLRKKTKEKLTDDFIRCYLQALPGLNRYAIKDEW